MTKENGDSYMLTRLIPAPIHGLVLLTALLMFLSAPGTLALPGDVFPITYTPIEGVATNKTQSLELDLSSHFTHSEGMPLTFSVRGLPEGLFLSQEEGIIRGAFAAVDEQAPLVYNVVFSASAGSASVDLGFTMAFFTGGTGEEDTPFEIERAEQLDALRSFLQPDRYFKLIRNLDLRTGDAYWVDSGWEPIGDGESPFQGHLDGSGHTISYLFLEESEHDYAGLFGALGVSASISNLNFTYAEIIGQDHVGVLAGSSAGAISGVTVSTAYVSGRDYAGGLTGSNSGSVYESGVIQTQIEARDFVGGLTGENASGQIDGSLFFTSDDTSINGNTHVGGLAGINAGAINDSGALAQLEGISTVGTLVGKNTADGTINRTVSAGIFEPSADSFSGQLTGDNAGTVEASFYINHGAEEDGTPGIASTMEDFANEEIFSGEGWDFETIWEMSTEDNFLFIAPLPRWVLHPRPVSITRMFGPLASFPPDSVPLDPFQARDINANSDANFPDPYSSLYRVVAVSSGTLTINGSDYDADNNFIGEYEGSQRTFFWVPDEGAAGLLDAFTVVAVSPSDRPEDTVPVQVQVLVNSAPETREIPDYTASTHRAVELDLKQFFSDPEGDAFTVSITDLPYELGLDDGVLSGLMDYVTALRIYVKAKDNYGTESETINFVLSIVRNFAPQSSIIPEATATVLRPFTLDLNDYFTDLDDETLTLEAQNGLPEGLSMENGILSGTPDSVGSYTITINAYDSYYYDGDPFDRSDSFASAELTLEVVAPPPPEEIPEEIPHPPAPDVGGDSAALDNALDDIVLPPAGQEVSPELLATINDAVNRATEIVENAALQLRDGNLSTGDALKSLVSGNKAVGKVGEAGTDSAGALRSLNGMSDLLNGLADKVNLSDSEKQQISDIAKTSLSNGGNLIHGDSTAEEVESVLNTTANLLNNALKTGAPLDEELATAAIQVSLKALNQLLPGFAAALGQEVDINDLEQVRQLMAEPVVLETALSNSIPVRSSTSIDDASASQELADQGVNVAAAQRILDSLRNAISNPSGIAISGSSSRTATQSLIDALLNAFGTGADNGVQGPGPRLFAASNPISVSVDPITGALQVASDTQRYAATSTNVRLVSDAIPEGVSFLPDGRAVAVSNGMAIELAPAPVDLLGFAAAIERHGFGISFNNNGSFTLDLGNGERFSGAFGFDNIGADSGACGTMTFAAPQGEVNAAGYAFEMLCSNGIRQHILPFVHDAAFYTAVSQSGLAVRTDRNTGIITVTGVGSFKPSFFVTPLGSEDMALRSEKGDPAIVVRAVAGVNGKVEYDVISATGVQRLHPTP